MVETVKSGKELVRHYMKAVDPVSQRVGIPVYVEGPPGVGKSEMFKQLAQEERIGFIDLRLAQLDPVDLRGLPAVQVVEKLAMTVWSRPDFWPQAKRDGEKGILLLDELGDCGKAMQSAGYQVVLDRRAGPHEILPGWYIAGAGNNMKHRAGAQPMSSALANRFAHIEIDADLKTFVEYGNRVGFNYAILGFLQARPKLLHDMPEAGAIKAFPTPRAWAKASMICDTPNDVRMKLIAGCVGEGAAGEFMAYQRVLDLPDFEEVVANPKKCKIPEVPSHRYALSSMLAQRVERSNFDKVMQYIQRSEFGRDFEISTVLDASKRDASLTETKAFTEFANRNADLTL
jgi:hypothetical protein